MELRMDQRKNFASKIFKILVAYLIFERPGQRPFFLSLMEWLKDSVGHLIDRLPAA